MNDHNRRTRILEHEPGSRGTDWGLVGCQTTGRTRRCELENSSAASMRVGRRSIDHKVDSTWRLWIAGTAFAVGSKTERV
jgi:hypothetical protein